MPAVFLRRDHFCEKTTLNKIDDFLYPYQRMSYMNIALLTGLMAGLFAIIAISEPVAQRVRLPNAMVLAIAGCVLGVSATALSTSTFAIDMGWEFRNILQLRIPSSLFLGLFLPALIFQVALSLDVKRMMEDWLPIFIMAVLAVVLATVTVGFALSPFTSLPLYACLLIGAIVSTTDPSAVIDIFKSISSPPRLVRIIQGESLLNDATAIALFTFFMAMVTAGVPDPQISSIFIEIPRVMIGGLLVGWLAATLVLPVMSMMGSLITAQISLSLGLPFMAFLVAEHLGLSGVIAVFSAGVTLNFSGLSRLSSESWSKIREAWNLMAHWAGALIFLMAALLIPRLLSRAEPSDALLVAVVLVSALLSRAVILWGVLPLLERLKLSPPIGHAYRGVILWGGLRGAVTLALALAVTEAPFVSSDIKHAVGVIATGYVLSVFVIQGLTLRPLIRKLGLDRLPPIDQALSSQVVAVALQSVREKVSEGVRDRGMDHEVVRSEAKRLGEITQKAVDEAEATKEVLAREKVALGLIALAGRELDLVISASNEGRISPALHARMVMDAGRLLEYTRTRGRNGYNRASRMSMGHGRALKLAVFLQRRLRIARPLSKLTASRMEVLVAQVAIMDELHDYINSRIRRIHGKRVTEILHETLSRRQEEITALIEGLKLQYPGYSAEVQKRWIRRMSLLMEEKEYDTLLKDSLIDPDLHKSLMQRIQKDRRELDTPLRLDMMAQKGELLRRMELFKDLDDKAVSQLSRALHLRYVEPGEVLQVKGEIPKKVSLIASGAVQVTRKTGSYMLGQGDFFGHISLLSGKPRQAEMKAVSHGTLFELEEARFRRLLAGNSYLKKALHESARRMDINISKEDLSLDL
jgi:CPA1 family monovalent cation:H+ antiporter